jgi:hypothetical protein
MELKDSINNSSIFNSPLLLFGRNTSCAEQNKQDYKRIKKAKNREVLD